MDNINIPAIDLKDDQVHNIVERYHELKESSKDVRCREFILEDDIKWTSWIVRESVYKKKPGKLPGLARGLFTKKTNGKHSIMVRGYDKFFNVFETAATQWPALETETTGPYEITAKENGCIIFIAALSKDKIVVTSKHSIPEDKTDIKAHAGVGYNWVIKHLASVDKKEKDLAEWLFEKGVTLVAELCDDEFEQHILPYTGKLRGLYLHGINYNTSTLQTLPSATVQRVALAFGFHTTSFETFSSIKEVKQFAEEMQRTGYLNGREIEGVVVRCKRDGNDFMFKIKNEQYLQYREYREITKSLLHIHSDGTVSIDPTKQAKYRYEKTKFYIDWLKEKVKEHPEWFKEYKAEKGIIQTRQEFEEYWKETGSSAATEK
ncbi:hypothetical protein G6F46_005332 [Rhizopus delemar]|uniref:T4 RNA ligase 1-like N-terminal domain-containing protein n=2 Tax=Rhizopus TaxID=4842 RepID=A0A9P6ZG73_9FUNG|nr:hypothetical protein G6F55_000768 [Rhizopus delemar]KAG1545294.1 hypothetical protein G6F51_005555 [Rhizopus arrhizus]KAG1500135.1 hypothetical protein G6F54_003926 [Rhizopus delemar]KAG1512715.1 hypothetical protein G6F53_004977 [Rhizopus delemar]KAG1521932.1 hypothetical protein G6F52_006301 [Rhizopus delemar]